MAGTTTRALALLNLLQTHRSWTGPELAERLGVSDRTLRRDVERLREQNPGATPAEGAGRQMSGSRMSPSTWYGPLNSSPKSPWSSPWSVVNTTSTSSVQPLASIAARTRPIASSISSTSTALTALTSRTWSLVSVAGTQWAGAS